MITEKDLQEAIAECQGKRDPDASTCIKLAAFYTIRRELFGKEEAPPIVPTYSLAPPAMDTTENIVNYDSGSEFSRIINGRTAAVVWGVMDELMSILNSINPKLYKATIHELNK